MSRRPYIREVSKSGWWLAQPRYIRYMLREVSALFIGAYALLLIVGLYQLSSGEAAYAIWLAAVEGSAGIIFAVLAFVFAIYHTYTWFQVTPKAMPLMFAGRRIPGPVIVAVHWLGFVALSTAVWLLAGS
jgi:fumarate reductase subunit C